MEMLNRLFKWLVVENPKVCNATNKTRSSIEANLIEQPQQESCNLKLLQRRIQAGQQMCKVGEDWKSLGVLRVHGIRRIDATTDSSKGEHWTLDSNAGGEREWERKGKKRKDEGDGRSNFECLTCAPNGPLPVLSTFPSRSHFLAFEGHDSVIHQQIDNAQECFLEIDNAQVRCLLGVFQERKCDTSNLKIKVDEVNSVSYLNQTPIFGS